MKNATLFTWGCTHNQKDSQLIESQLIKGGFKLLPVSQVEHADIVILNTCTVKTPTENKIFHVLDSLKQSNKQVIVSGCLSQADPELLKKKYPDFVLLGVNAAPYILPVLNSIETSNSLIYLTPKLSENQKIKDNSNDWFEKPTMDSTQWNEHRNIIQINEGCLNYCTFCATKKARGHLRSYKRVNIIEAIRKNYSSEVWLTSQDTACWGFDVGDNLAKLIDEIDKIERKFWVRVGMGNPNNFIKILKEILQSFTSDKIYKFLHLPVQVGSNDLLKHMRRGYTIEEYEEIVNEFRKKFPNFTLSTDVICGYPTETLWDFQETIKTIERTRPSITNISRYWERRGTVASKLKQLPFNVRKERSQILTKLCRTIQQEDNKTWIGWKGEIYLAEEGSKGGIQARNIDYKPIIVDAPLNQLGKWSFAKIVEATPTYFIGEIN